MKFIDRNTCRSFFKVVCVVLVFFMVSYWLYKFEIEDRDIGVVDYASIQESNDVEFPLLSICLVNPFLIAKLKEVDPQLNGTTYLKYLKGDFFEERFQYIDYENMTLNLNDYFSHGFVKLTNETYLRNETVKFKHTSIFSGFYHAQDFVKCFSAAMDNMDNRNIETIILGYNKQNLLNDLSGPLGIGLNGYFNIYHPEQFLLEINTPRFFVFKEAEIGLRAFVTSIEVLERRHTRNKKCMNDWKFYDELVLQKHIKSKGCRAPYHDTFKGFAVCSTRETIKESMYEFMDARKKYYPKACHRISKIDIEWFFGQVPIADGTWEFEVAYPEEIKIITQAKEVDGHSLIGNIGGYIGLFLGNTNYYGMPTFWLYIYILHFFT